jgi:exonuclease VII small subunit
MRKSFFYTAVLLLLLIALLSAKYSAKEVFANSDNASPTPTQRVLDKRFTTEKQRILEQIRIRDKNENRNLHRLSEERKRRLYLYWERVFARFEATIERLEKITKRIESRLEKIKSEDPSKNLDEVYKLVEESKSKLDLARTKLLAVKGTIDNIIGSEDPKNSLKVAKEQMKEVKALIRDAHSALVHAIGKIKGLRFGEEKAKS